MAVMKGKKKFITLFMAKLIIIWVILYALVNSSNAGDSFNTKNIQISEMYENWLLLRSDVLSYLGSKSPSRMFDKESLMISFERMDASMIYLVDEDVFRRMERYYPHIKDIRQCLVYNWQKIQFQLTSILYRGEQLDEFTSLIIWFSKDTQEMDRFFGLLRYFAQDVNRKQQRKNLIMTYLVIIGMILLSSFVLIRKSQIEHKLAHEAEMQKMIKAMLSIRNDERKRIALDIHDSLVHRLRELKIYVDNSAAGDMKAHISSEISSTIDIARDISFNLIPFITSSEAGEDFVNVIRNYAAETLMGKNIKLNITSLGMNKINIPENLRINIFRIIQEILNNVVKYSKAEEVRIKFLFSHPYIIFTISDDGVGIPDNVLRSVAVTKNHIGLYGLQERARLFGGTLKITSKTGEGTKINVRIPFKGNEND